MEHHKETDDDVLNLLIFHPNSLKETNGDILQALKFLCIQVRKPNLTIKKLTAMSSSSCD